MMENRPRIDRLAGASGTGMPGETGAAMLVPQNALRILRNRTGGGISRATFYRWISNGTVDSIRVGSRILIPWPALEKLIRRCFEGD